MDELPLFKPLNWQYGCTNTQAVLRSCSLTQQGLACLNYAAIVTPLDSQLQFRRLIPYLASFTYLFPPCPLNNNPQSLAHSLIPRCYIFFIISNPIESRIT